MPVEGSIAAGDEVLDLPLDIAQERAGADAKRSGSSQSRPSSSFIRNCQFIASFAVLRPPAGLKPILKPASSR